MEKTQAGRMDKEFWRWGISEYCSERKHFSNNFRMGEHKRCIRMVQIEEIAVAKTVTLKYVLITSF